MSDKDLFLESIDYCGDRDSEEAKKLFKFVKDIANTDTDLLDRLIECYDKLHQEMNNATLANAFLDIIMRNQK